MNSKEEALKKIAEMAKSHSLSLAEIEKTIRASEQTSADSKTSSVRKLFAYLGGSFVFAGIAAYIGMFWDEMSSLPRILITLGSGFAAYILSLIALSDKRYEKIVTPLLIIAGLLQPTGILVLLYELHRGGDKRHAILFAAGIMLLQQAVTFLAKKRGVLLFFTVTFFSIFFLELFNILDLAEKWVAVIIGISLLCISYAISKTPHRAMSGFWYFFGSASFLCGAYEILRNTPLTLLHLALGMLMMFLSTVTQSKSLLVVSTISIVGYLGYYTNKYFMNSIGWPLTLIAIGFILLGVGSLAFRIQKRWD